VSEGPAHPNLPPSIIVPRSQAWATSGTHDLAKSEDNAIPLALRMRAAIEFRTSTVLASSD